MIQYGVTIPSSIECFPNTLYVENLEYGERKTSWGFYIPAETMKISNNFVRPRWAKVLFKADNIKNIDIGDWILIPHGRWSSSIKAEINGREQDIWFVNPKSYKMIMAKSKEMPKELGEYI